VQELEPEDGELLADIEQSAAPAGAERAVGVVSTMPAGPAAPAVPAVARGRDTGGLQKAAASGVPLSEAARSEARKMLDDTLPMRIDGFAGGIPRSSAKRNQTVALPPAAGLPPAALPAVPFGTGRPADLPASASELWVRVRSGPSAGRELPITGDEFVLGSVGQQVAKLVRRDGAWTLVRVEGSAPLVLNGAAVSGESAFVAPGDRFVVAGSEVEVERR
jgi:hypothetical protein